MAIRRAVEKTTRLAQADFDSSEVSRTIHSMLFACSDPNATFIEQQLAANSHWLKGSVQTHAHGYKMANFVVKSMAEIANVVEKCESAFCDYYTFTINRQFRSALSTNRTT